ncbi:MAG: hypothetical protein HYZ47_02295 [Simkania negevensis]|nr:hypothetical protein [Simkania negevensis]
MSVVERDCGTHFRGQGQRKSRAEHGLLSQKETSADLWMMRTSSEYGSFYWPTCPSHPVNPVILSFPSCSSSLISVAFLPFCKSPIRALRGIRGESILCPTHSACITTIVTTDLFSLIASSFHIPCFKVLTGFKYIGEKIHEWEVSPTGYHFLFGAEESYGFLYGTHSRDKDAIISACLLSEIALEQKLEGKTLIDLLHQIYFQYGLFHEKQLSLSFDGGVSAMGTMKMLMTVLRKTPPKEICNKKVVVIKDYQTGIEQNLLTEEKGELTLPRSDVLLLLLEDESKFVIRPSGTEPKIKIYGMVRKNVTDAIDVTMKECEKKLDLMLEKLKEQFL